MSHPNIDKFNETAGKAFARLYINFPTPVSLEPDFFVGEEGVRQKGNPEFDGLLFTPEAEFCFACMKWLMDSGYIRGRLDENMLACRGVVLTAKGLEALKLSPSALEASFGDRLVSALKENGFGIMSKTAGTLLTYGLHLVTTGQHGQG